jgi:hypothetical protein
MVKAPAKIEAGQLRVPPVMVMIVKKESIKLLAVWFVTFALSVFSKNRPPGVSPPPAVSRKRNFETCNFRIRSVTTDRFRSLED